MKTFIIQITGNIDKHDINDIRWKIEEWMDGEELEFEMKEIEDKEE